MRTASSRAPALKISTLGAAFPEPPFSCVVHSPYAAALNLAVDAPGGPSGFVLHTLLAGADHFGPACALVEAAPPLDGLGLKAGTRGRTEGASLVFDGGVRFDLAGADRRGGAGPFLSAGAVPDAAALGRCAAELDRRQRTAGTALRWADLVRPDGDGGSDLARRFRTAAAALDTALSSAAAHDGTAHDGTAHDGTAHDGTAHGAAVSAALRLSGLGPGLTPAGDDFLCGYALAAWLRTELPPGAPGRFDPGTVGLWLSALAARAAAPPRRTTDLALSYLTLASQRLFSDALRYFAVSAAQNSDAAAWEGPLSALGSLGHSSGYDGATGVLYGLSRAAAGPSTKEVTCHGQAS